MSASDVKIPCHCRPDSATEVDSLLSFFYYYVLSHSAYFADFHLLRRVFAVVRQQYDVESVHWFRHTNQ